MASPGLTAEERAAAERLAAAVNAHVAIEREAGRDRPGFIIIKLEDGSCPDNTVYDSRKDAIQHDRWAPHTFYVRIGKDTMPFKEAVIVLQNHRRAFKAGIRFAEEEVITPQLPELMAPFIPRTLGALGLVGGQAQMSPQELEAIRRAGGLN